MDISNSNYKSIYAEIINSGIYAEILDSDSTADGILSLSRLSTLYQDMSKQSLTEVLAACAIPDTPLFRMNLMLTCNSQAEVCNFKFKYLYILEDFDYEAFTDGPALQPLLNFLCLKGVDSSQHSTYIQLYLIMQASYGKEEETGIGADLLVYLTEHIRLYIQQLIKTMPKKDCTVKQYILFELEELEYLRSEIIAPMRVSNKDMELSIYMAIVDLSIKQGFCIYILNTISSLAKKVVKATLLPSLDVILRTLSPFIPRSQLHAYKCIIYVSCQNVIDLQPLLHTIREYGSENIQLKNDLATTNKALKTVTDENQAQVYKLTQAMTELAQLKEELAKNSYKNSLKTLQTKHNNMQAVLDDTMAKLQASEKYTKQLQDELKYLETYKERVQIMEDCTDDDLVDNSDDSIDKTLMLQNYRIVLVTTVPDWGTRFENFLTDHSIACRVVKDGIMPKLYDTDLVVINVLGIPHSYFYKLKQQLNGTPAKVLCVPNFNFDRYLTLMYKKVTDKNK